MADYDDRLSDYNTVPERIADFREKHPEGSLQPVDPAKPFWSMVLGDKVFICYAAAAYRTPDDPRPGIGVAWEPFPGRTPYTRDSELMNSETGAWGRAIVATLAADAKKGVATAEDINRRAQEQDIPYEPPRGPPRKSSPDFRSVGWPSEDEGKRRHGEAGQRIKVLDDEGRQEFEAWKGAEGITWPYSPANMGKVDGWLDVWEHSPAEGEPVEEPV